MRAAKMDHDWAWPTGPRGRVRRHAATSTGGSARSGDVQIRDGLHPGPKIQPGETRWTWCCRSCGPGSSSAVNSRCRAAAGARPGRGRSARRDSVDAAEDGPASSSRPAGRRLGSGRRRRSDRQPRGGHGAAVRCHRGGPATGRHLRRDPPGAARTGRPLHRGGAVGFAAARSGQRAAHRSQLLPVDPKAVPSKLAWETGAAMADSLLARYRDDHGRWPESVGLSVWGTSAM